MTEEPKYIYVVETACDDIEVSFSHGCGFFYDREGVLGCFSSKEKAIGYLKHIKDNNLIRLHHTRFSKNPKIIIARKVELDSYDYDYDLSYDACIKQSGSKFEIEVRND